MSHKQNHKNEKSFFTYCFSSVIFTRTSCSNEYVFTLEHQKQVSFNATIPISLKEKEDKPVQKVQFFVNGKEIPSEGSFHRITN